MRSNAGSPQQQHNNMQPPAAITLEALNDRPSPLYSNPLFRTASHGADAYANRVARSAHYGQIESNGNPRFYPGLPPQNRPNQANFDYDHLAIGDSPLHGISPLPMTPYAPMTRFVAGPALLPGHFSLRGNTPPGNTPRSPTILNDDSSRRSMQPHLAHMTGSPNEHSLSFGDFQVANVFLEWIQNPEAAPLTFATLIAQKGFKVVPLASPAGTKKRKRSLLDGEAALRYARVKRGTSTTYQWWSRLLNLTASQLRKSLSDADKLYMANYKAFLSGFTVGALDSFHPSGDENSPLCRTVLYTLTLDNASFNIAVMQIVMRLFFYIICQTKAKYGRFSRDKEEIGCRVLMVDSNNLSDLYTKLRQHLPERIADLCQFKRELQNWRVQGSAYAFIAQRLGLGSLILLRPHIEKVWGCSKGGERSGISTYALNHLEAIGLPEMACAAGADKLMHDLVWEACSDFPAFGLRDGDEPFPGFQYKGMQIVHDETHTERDADTDTDTSTSINDADHDVSDNDSSPLKQNLVTGDV